MKESQRLRSLSMRTLSARVITPPLASPTTPKEPRRSWYGEQLQRAAVPCATPLYITYATLLSAAAFLILFPIGLLLSSAALTLSLYYFLYAGLHERAVRIQRASLRDLVAFVESLDFLVGGGATIESAWTNALSAVRPSPLADELQRVSVSVRSGQSLSDAIQQFTRRNTGYENLAFGASMSLLIMIGGKNRNILRSLAATLRARMLNQRKFSEAHRLIRHGYTMTLLLAVIVVPLLVTLWPTYFQPALSDGLSNLVFQCGGCVLLTSLLLSRREALD